MEDLPPRIKDGLKDLLHCSLEELMTDETITVLALKDAHFDYAPSAIEQYLEKLT